MNRLCYHTFLRWEDKVATCAVCAKKFIGYPYTEMFVGTFPRDKYLEWKRSRTLNPVAFTFTTNPFEQYFYGGDNEDDDSAD